MIIGMDASRVDRARMTGTERYAREVLAALLRTTPTHAHRIYVRHPEAGAAIGGRHDEVICIRQARLWTHLGLGNELMRRPPDALFIPAHVLPIVCAAPALRTRMRMVVTVHDCGFRHFPEAHTTMQRLYLEWSTRFAAQHAHALIADSAATKRDVEKFFPNSRGKVHVAWPGAPEVPQADDAQIIDACVRAGVRRSAYLVHIGTRQPRKNLRRLIDAFAIARERLPAGMKLLLVGGAGWGGEDLARYAARAGASDAVVITGYVDDADKAALLRGASALAFPSLHEGFGFPVLEAQSAGVPVACSDTSSLPEAAGDGAAMFDPLNVEAMAAALCNVVLDEALRVRLIANGLRNCARFRWDDCARTVLDALTEVHR